MAATANPENSAAAAFLLHRINYERTTTVPYRSGEFKLDRMRRLMQLLGDPQMRLKAIHVAGTKGKGTTAAMIATVLQAAGNRTGLYTSPHLERIEERIAINGSQCPPEVFLQLAATVQPAVERLDREGAAAGEHGPTFFEVTTAMAFVYFAEEKVDAAVLEVGLGGRLDSTNICQPEVCVITSISFDHTKQLGNTLAAIAGEKAGIIKPGIPVVSGVLEPEPRDVIVARAMSQNAPLCQRGVDYGVVTHEPDGEQTGGQFFDYWESSDLAASAPDSQYSVPSTQYRGKPVYELRNIRLKMLGSHQAANAATAIAAINCLRERGWSISDSAIREGMAGARVPARIEQVETSPLVILDVAHNLASIEALLTVLREQFRARRRILVFASSKDKDYDGMLERLLPAFDTLILTQYINNPRAVDAGDLLRVAQQIRLQESSSQPVLHATVRPADALRLARLLAQPDDLICIAGSFFLAAELRPHLGAR